MIVKKDEIITKLIINSNDCQDDILFVNCIINKLALYENGFNFKVTISNCVIHDFCLSGILNKEIIIENCVIDIFHAVGAHLKGGCSLLNCVLKEIAAFTDGGHNIAEVKIENNVFLCFVDFLDNHFEGPLTFCNNLLPLRSNLLGNQGQTYKALLGENPKIEGNIGGACFKSLI